MRSKAAAVEGFFVYNQYDPGAGADARDADARLACLIVRYLRATRDHETGAWLQPGQRNTLRNTCHAAEVLYSLGLDASTEVFTRQAADWLVNLSEEERQPGEEPSSLRLYPSRFKTLALMGRFDDPEVLADFAELLRQQDRGMFHDGSDPRILVSCIVLETAHLLEGHSQVDRQPLVHARDALEEALYREWRRYYPPRQRKQDTTPPPPSLVKGPRELSYVMGLMHRRPRVSAAATHQRLVAQTRRELLKELGRFESVRSATGHVPTLYAALQLAQCFPNDAEIHAALDALLVSLRQRYASRAVRDWDLFAHTLMLRVLMARYGTVPLRQRITAYLIEHTEREEDAQQRTLAEDFEHVIRERMGIASEIEPISGGYTDADVFRVSYSLTAPSVAKSGRVLDTGSLIIKRSSGEALRRTEENYARLPAGVGMWFAQQPTEGSTFPSRDGAAHYLVMEDLADMSTLHDHLQRWDQKVVSAASAELVRSAARRVWEAVSQVFVASRKGTQHLHGMQLSRLYLSSLEDRLMRALDAVPWLKNPAEGWRINEERCRDITWYLTKINKYRDHLEPRYLGIIHGDLHARNVMLDRDCHQVKFIDLDHLAWAHDYMADVGMLLEYVLVTRRLADAEAPYGLRTSQIVIDERSGRGGASEGGINYPALGRQATVLFQQEMLDRIRHYAESADESEGEKKSLDPTWKPRLWLATATALIRRLSYQSQREPAAVLLAEAMRLLHELCASFDGQPLPDLLVPATWPKQQASAEHDTPPWLLAKPPVVTAIHEALRASGLQTGDGMGGAIRYYRRQDEPPLATLAPGRKAPAILKLRAASPEGLPPSPLRV
ncbi:MAG TPA: phosphotransferase, partial [Ktedonobacterales bacterium]